jgi:hypothetical protein
MRTLYRSLLVAILFSIGISSNAAWNLYKSGVGINGGYYDCLLNTVASDFQNSYFGRYTSAGTLTLNYGEVYTYKNSGGNVCGADMYYRVYRTCDAPPAFTTLNTPFYCEFFNNPIPCGPDIGAAGDQKWQGTSGINLITALTLPGTYIIEIYFAATGHETGGNCGASTTNYANNGGVNYRAYFEYSMNDNFTDLDFNTPTWSGDVGSFTLINNSTCSGLLGTEAYRTHTVRLNAPLSAATDHIRTQIATWDTQQEWYFWTGRNSINSTPQHLTTANQTIIWLYGNEANLESGTVDGYRIQMGDDSGDDEIRLQRVDNGVATTIFTSALGVFNGVTDYGISFKVRRSQSGVWTIYTSTLPTSALTTQSTPTPNSCPEVLSTVNHGGATDNTYVPAANGYFGFMSVHSAGLPATTAVEFDNFRFLALPPDTYFSVNGSVSGSVAEDAALAGNIVIGVDIFNQSSTVASSVQIVLTSGAAARVGTGPNPATAYAGPYTTQTLTWPAATSGTKFIYIDPDDNGLCDDIANLTFTLQNASGGTNAYVGTPNSYALTVNDDNMGYETLLTENFNSGTIPVAWVTNGTAWAASNVAPISGSHSARHSTQANAGSSSISYPLDDVCLPGVQTTWRFQLKYQDDASANNNFQVFLAASEANLYNASVNGYAIVIDQTSLPSVSPNDLIRLYRVTNNVYAASPIINTALDWNTNVNSGNKVGFEITLNDQGTWELKVDVDGDFDNLVSQGTGQDIGGGGLTYPSVKNFGVRFLYTASKSDFIRFDDVSIAQKGCKQLYYSQSSGARTASIWGTAPVSSSQIVNAGRYSRFIIQSGHNVTSTGTYICQDISINSGGTLDLGSSSMKVFGNWINDGTFTSGTSTVSFKGSSAQSILGTQNSVFHHLTIDNDGFSVTMSAPVTVKGVVRPEEGTLQTGGNLTLASTSTYSGSIGEIKAGASVTENIILQRYIPSIPWIYGNWVNIGCPILGQTVQDWNDDIVTSGFIGSDYPPPYPFNNVTYYNESVAGAMSLGYVPATNVTNALLANAGYFVWMQGGAQTMINTGAFQTGTISQPMTYTVTGGGVFADGWNLMTNQYPSEVDWNLVSTSLTGPRVYYVFDHQTNAYKNYNAASGLGSASRYIPHSQSFLVKVNAGGQNLQFQESYKTNNGTAFERSEEAEISFVALQVSKDGMSDEAILHFNGSATAQYDNYDVFDLESPNADAVEMSFVSSDNVNLAQDARPSSDNLSIPVYLDLPSGGSYEVSVVEIRNLPIGSCLMVEDIVTGQMISFQEGEHFTVTVDQPYQGNRLVIHTTASAELFVSNVSCNGSADGAIDVSVPEGNWNVTLTDEWNNEEYVANGGVTFDNLEAGTYYLTLENSNLQCQPLPLSIVVAEPQAMYTSLSDTDIVLCNTGNSGSIEWNVNNANWFAYSIENSNGEIIASGELDGNIGELSGLSADVYELNIFHQCGTETMEVSLKDPNGVYANIVNAPAVLYINNNQPVEFTFESTLVNATSAEWNFGDGAVVVGETATVAFATPGIHTILLTASGNNCVTTDQTEVEVQSTVGMNEWSQNNGISFIQRDGGIEIVVQNEITAKGQLLIYNSVGQLVSKERLNASRQFIQTSDLSKGMYTLQVQVGERTIASKKIINE